MPVIDHFTYGIITPLLAYALSCTGAATALSCTSRARAATGVGRSIWLVLGAVALGGTGIWVMHFIGMLGFGAVGVTIRYDVPLTLLSALVAVVVVGAGLFIVDMGKGRTPAIVVGGVLAGTGVAAMHYMGMAAMQMSADVQYSVPYVIASIAIAVVAATAALWCTVNIRGIVATIIATAVMGLAVCGMHFTGMAGISLTNPSETIPLGASTTELLVPLVMGVSVVTFMLILVIGLWPTEAEIRAQAEFEAKLQQRKFERKQFERVQFERLQNDRVRQSQSG
ncbi:MHYT domain-containing protein [Antribacter gilvus]|uniref:MHYT domain-containing protein n=1 Tax=Antribacter gilvus TaxID=2304675 RepID=UPI001F0C2122|nr:MHYT domain-containing protein [Antribacter gilvus]